MTEHETPEIRPGGVLFAVLFLLAAVFLLSQLGAETKFSGKTIWSKKLFAQPRFWPAVGVIGMCLFGAAHLFVTWRRRVPGTTREALTWARALEYLVWFMAYVFAVPVIGYLPASIIFAVALAARAGYRSRGMLGAAALTGLGVVVIFKALLQVKIPGGAIYEHLPDGLRNFAILYL